MNAAVSTEDAEGGKVESFREKVTGATLDFNLLRRRVCRHSLSSLAAYRVRLYIALHFQANTNTLTRTTSFIFDKVLRIFSPLYRDT